MRNPVKKSVRVLFDAILLFPLLLWMLGFIQDKYFEYTTGFRHDLFGDYYNLVDLKDTKLDVDTDVCNVYKVKDYLIVIRIPHEYIDKGENGLRIINSGNIEYIIINYNKRYKKVFSNKVDFLAYVQSINLNLDNVINEYYEKNRSCWKKIK